MNMVKAHVQNLPFRCNDIETAVAQVGPLLLPLMQVTQVTHRRSIEPGDN